MFTWVDILLIYLVIGGCVACWRMWAMWSVVWTMVQMLGVPAKYVWASIFTIAIKNTVLWPRVVCLKVVDKIQRERGGESGK